MSTEPEADRTKVTPTPARNGAPVTPVAKPAASFADVEAGQTVRYCVSRPYAAGEHVDITDAEVTAIDPWTGVVSLEYTVSGAVTVEKEGVPYSEKYEPGTWHRAA